MITDKDNSNDKYTLCYVRLRPEFTPLVYAVKDIPVKDGEWVIVPTDHGPEVGQIMKSPIKIGLSPGHLPPLVERLATNSEIEDYYKNLELEQQGKEVCLRLISSLGLKMKLVRVERFFDGSKIIFYYSADGRIDFRELVKGLVRELRIRVEMRQIGIRHEAKLIGGIGFCGRELCCASFLSGFDPISIKMAKIQNLPLNPNKISGVCGRLLCCLTYEYETYREMSQDLPDLGKACDTPDGTGKVVRHNIFKQAITVAMPNGTYVEYTLDELEGKSEPDKHTRETETSRGEGRSPGEGDKTDTKRPEAEVQKEGARGSQGKGRPAQTRRSRHSKGSRKKGSKKKGQKKRQGKPSQKRKGKSQNHEQ